MKKFCIIATMLIAGLCFSELFAASPASSAISGSPADSAATSPHGGSYSQSYDRLSGRANARLKARAHIQAFDSGDIGKDTIYLINKPRYMVVGNRLMKIPVAPRHIDWRPEQQDVRRYTFAVSPLYVLNNGIRLDFERELSSDRGWMQYHLMLCGKDWYNGKDYVPYYVDSEGWSSMISSYETYSKLFGIGAGIAYKRMMSPRGWYFSLGGAFNYYNVWFYADLYNTGSGETVLMNNGYYQFAVNFNFGKHFALTDNLFLDLYAGLGMKSYVADADPRYAEFYYDRFWGMYAFEYSGAYLNGGIRIGWLWNRPKK